MNRQPVAIFLLLGFATALRADDPSRQVDFFQDVQPILVRHCDRCHGSRKQEAELQLNLRDSAYGRAASDQPIIVKHDPDASLLIQRISGDGFGDVMPLDGDPLSKRELTTLRTWVAQGAKWPDTFDAPTHWAYQRITRPDVPDSHAKLPVDYFLERSRRSRGLTASEQLDRPRLIRRLSLALTGIPPTLAEVDRFVNDKSVSAYADLVDRLLASPRFGERWAVPWLDLARYADSNGFQADQIRENWAYRDWVIRAFNDDLPFDQFVTDQIAGDLRENPTDDQRIATGFHRMTTCNVEAGVHPEANRVNQVVDRVNTTATVFLGTTMECAQCHDHKYDPFTQIDYYQFFAYFNNTPLEVKNTADVTWDFDGPSMTLPASEATNMELTAAQEEWQDLSTARQSLVDEAEELFQAFLADRESKNKQNNNIERLRDSFFKKQPPLVQIDQKIATAKKRMDGLAPVTTLVMVEMAQRRETFVMVRGNHENLGAAVVAATPAALTEPDAIHNGDRMELAKWLTSTDNPLLRRVTVNRWWAELFGHGIVGTPEDFGTQGDAPTHPLLLDWLSSELLDSGWSMKHVIKLMVMSDAFQQSARVTAETLEQDPDNRWLTRGPRFRLKAELVRDNALAISGLLSPQMFGRPIMPYQPDGIWRSVGRNQPKWETANDENRFRRGVYVVWKRAAPYPSFVNFDAPNRGNCTVSRGRSNTPLQALTLLNDPAYTEMALAFAQLVVGRMPESTDQARIEFAIRQALARSATEQEKILLDRLLVQERATLERDRSMIAKRIGNVNLPPEEAAELAAWFSLCNTLLNLDEVICH